MTARTPSSVVFPIRIASPSGLSVEVNSNGSILRMDHGDIMLNLFLGNEADGGLANIYMRHIGESMETIPLLGPASPASYEMDERGFTARGKWKTVSFCVRLILAESATAPSRDEDAGARARALDRASSFATALITAAECTAAPGLRFGG